MNSVRNNLNKYFNKSSGRVISYGIKKLYRNCSKGFGLVEIIVGTSIISLSLVGILTAFNLFMRTGLANTEKIQATYILEEGVEAFRYIRDSGWSSNIGTLTEGVPYYMVFDGSGWEATTTKTIIDEVFDRTVTLANVYRRDSDSDIVASTSPDQKTLDTNTIEVEVRVIWDKHEVVYEVNIVTYFTNIFDN